MNTEPGQRPRMAILECQGLSDPQMEVLRFVMQLPSAVTGDIGNPAIEGMSRALAEAMRDDLEFCRNMAARFRLAGRDWPTPAQIESMAIAIQRHLQEVTW